jgi:hypothetical protein
MKMRSLLILVALSLGAGSALAEVKTYKTTAAQLYEDFDANEVAASQKINGAPIEVTGLIYAIEEDVYNDAMILLDAGNGALVVLNLAPTQKPAAAKLRKGREITIRCKKISIGFIGSPYGAGCLIVT